MWLFEDYSAQSPTVQVKTLKSKKEKGLAHGHILSK